MTGAEVTELFAEVEFGVGDVEGLVDVFTMCRSLAFELADRLPECPGTREAVDRVRQAFEHAESALRCCVPAG